ncbi:Serine/threonine-protein kinase LMTK1 [Triplophysa tibetana]|uniref:Serine/threonine-protein kinase LMTK1 n=1 Tax=Triplophysa tibetana TaxID=1572043 RepID=A0A5A9N8Q9_9TELE|nr:Serine/threonine-protein kinase LMTK1 [Triplophysa tibetana]
MRARTHTVRPGGSAEGGVRGARVNDRALFASHSTLFVYNCPRTLAETQKRGREGYYVLIELPACAEPFGICGATQWTCVRILVGLRDTYTLTSQRELLVPPQLQIQLLTVSQRGPAEIFSWVHYGNVVERCLSERGDAKRCREARKRALLSQLSEGLEGYIPGAWMETWRVREELDLYSSLSLVPTGKGQQLLVSINTIKDISCLLNNIGDVWRYLAPVFQLLTSVDLGRHSLLYIKEIGHGWFGKVLLGEVNAGLSTTQVVVKELKASASVHEQIQFLEEVAGRPGLVSPGNNILVLTECMSQTPASVILLLGENLSLNELHQSFDDYYVTSDQIWVPLRWIAPELIDEVHGNLLIVDQTKASNVWSLGVTIWELFELGNQPYRHYSDRQVLTYAIKEQQLKLPKPLLKVPLSERWSEVMQFCWLQPEQRPVVEEVHLLLSYLCAKGTTETEEDFEKRWNSLRPSLGSGSSHRTPAPELASSASSSFPLLEHFSIADSFQSENGDDILTVTETSQGLNFEYKWEQGRAEQPYCSSSASGQLGTNNPHYQDVYYPLSNSPGSCKGESLPIGVAPSYYESDHPGVVPVLSAHSPSVCSEYYIRIEEPVECNINLEDSVHDYSPTVEASNNSLSSLNRRSPVGAQPNIYWSAAKEPISNDYDSDSSPTMEPLQRTVETDHHEEYFSSNERQNFLHEESPQARTDLHLIRSQDSSSHQQRRGSESLCHRLEVVRESPPGVSVSLSSPSLAHCDPYLESNHRAAERSTACEAYYAMMGPLQKNVHRPHYISVDIDAGEGLLLSRGSAETEDDDLFSQNSLTNWTSNHSANNNSLSDRTQAVGFSDAYLDLRHPTPSSHVGNLQSRVSETSNTSVDSLKVHSYMEATDSTATLNTRTDSEGGEYLHLCPEGSQDVETSSKSHFVPESQHIHPQQNISHKHIKEMTSDFLVAGYDRTMPSAPTEIVASKENILFDTRISPAQNKVKSVKNMSCPKDSSETISECSHGANSGVVPKSSISLVEINDCSDDVTDINPGDYRLEYAEVGHFDRQRVTESTHHKDTINLASCGSLCEAFSPDSYHTSIQPKSLDSGYDTENNESPEFIMKDLEGNPALSTSVESDECDMVLQMDLDEDVNLMLLHPSGSSQHQYRDSAYFSDYDTENDKSPSERVFNFFVRQEEDNDFDVKAERKGSVQTVGLQLGSASTSAPVISMLSPFPPEMGGCLTKESTPDDGIGLESDHSGDEPNSDCYSSTVSEGSTSTQEASGIEGQANGDARCYSSAESLGSDSTIVEFGREIFEALEQDDCSNPELLKEGNNEKREGTEDAMEDNIGLVLSRQKHANSLESILPALPDDLDIPAPLGNGEEADEDTDSDESDEELRSYNIQEQSDESDEELPMVPVIVSDRSSARHLRSLLKMPSIMTQSYCDELDGKKKAVSFFDDVTVFLFDQESPTGELADYSFPVETEPNGQASEVDTSQPQDRVTTSDDSLQITLSEESGELWQGDFPSMPSPSTSEASSEEITTPPNSPITSPDEKPAPPLSRFSVSRFSITHVSDSDVNSKGGNSENGAQE